jgi:uncharacterized protein (TIGR00369 family)
MYQVMNAAENHFRRLEQLFLLAPVQQQFKHLTIHIRQGYAEISYPVVSDFFHGGGSLHGAAYFKLLDDAAYFAAASLVNDRFLLTASYDIRLLAPVTSGILTAIGTCASAEGRTIYASSTLQNEQGVTVAAGEGRFQRGKQSWVELQDYIR